MHSSCILTEHFTSCLKQALNISCSVLKIYGITLDYFNLSHLTEKQTQTETLHERTQLNRFTVFNVFGVAELKKLENLRENNFFMPSSDRKQVICG